MPTVPPLSITDEERAELQRRVRAHTTPQRAAKRARVVLLAAEGVPNRQIATLVGMNQHTVSHWRHRFEAERLAGLEDRPRPGRPLVYGHDQRLRILATVTQQPPDPASHWSHSQLAKALADIGISASQIGRILADLDLKPHRVLSGPLRRRDLQPLFSAAARKIAFSMVSCPTLHSACRNARLSAEESGRWPLSASLPPSRKSSRQVASRWASTPSFGDSASSS